jgi:hypothetical protein
MGFLRRPFAATGPARCATPFETGRGIRRDLRTGSYPELSPPPHRSHKQKIQAKVEHSYVGRNGWNQKFARILDLLGEQQDVEIVR